MTAAKKTTTPRKRAAKKVAAPEFVEASAVEVTAVEYNEDDDWDGTPEVLDLTNEVPSEETPHMSDTVETPEKAKRGRTVSPLITATREFEATHKAADKARAAYAKVESLAVSKEAAEAAEQAAYDALQVELSKLGG